MAPRDAKASKPSSGATPEEYEALCGFLRQRTGLSFGENKRYYVERRVVDRMKAVGATAFRDYLNLLRFQASGEELQLLVNQMTVNETYFFREKYQFDCLVSSVLDEIVRDRRPGDRIRIWSAGCSTGEEPYSIAIMLLEFWKRVDEFEIELHASDIDSRALAAARAGVYEERSLQFLPPHLVSKYFTQEAPGRWRIMQDLRESIDFSHVNLMDPDHVRRFANLDVIFCRNMLIYFDDLGRREVAAGFWDALAPGGFVFLGHSESMARMSSLYIPRRFPEAIVYQKGPGEGQKP